MTDAVTLLQKVDTTLAQIAANGLLEPEEAKKFIRLAIQDPVMLSTVNVMTMGAPRKQIPKSRFAGRVMRAGVEATALGVADRVAPDLSQIELVTQLYKAETRLSDEAAEDQIEGGQFIGTIRAQLTEAMGRDLEHIAINSDDATVVIDQETLLLSLQDGWLIRAGANLVAAGGVALDTDVLRDLRLAMPSEFRRDARKLRYYTNDGTVLRFMDSQGQRLTPEGDRVQRGQGAFQGYMNVGLVEVPLFPTALGVGANETQVLLSDPANLVFGIQRQIKLEADRDKHAGVVSLIASVRAAIHIIEDTATARADAVLA